MTGTSDNFLRWTDPVLLEYPDAPIEHLYTNAILPYERAPHLLSGFPTRYLPQEGQRVEPIFMTSRDGREFHRRRESLIPGTAPQDCGVHRSNYMAWGMVRLPGATDEYSMYASHLRAQRHPVKPRGDIGPTRVSTSFFARSRAA